MGQAHNHDPHDHSHSGHDHGDHEDGHGHHHHGLVEAASNMGPAFAIGLILNLGFLIVEFVYGLLAQSMALVADAGHNLGDVLGLVLAWAASMLVDRRPSGRRTYGFKRSSILASVANAVILLVATGAISIEAIRRLLEPQAVATLPVIIVASIGVMINGATALLLHQGHRRSGQNDINIRSAIAHMAADALVSVAVVVATVIIWQTGLTWIDPALGLIVAGVIVVGSWSLLRQSLDLALDAVPDGIDPDEVGTYLGTLPGVTEIHDLHIWGMSTTETALTVHLICPEAGLGDAMLSEAACYLKDRFKIGHATFQIEQGNNAYPCGLASAEIV